jgi:hypothetical protein
MKNIHLIPTDKPGRLYAKDNSYKSANSTMAMDWYISSAGYKPQNIYITSEKEDFNENDYVIKKDGRLVQVSYLLSKDLDGGSKVVIASDPDLIADGVQAIDDEFLEWFVKNPSCEEVEVGKTNKLIDNYAEKEEDKWEVKYHIYIPQEEPKQEIIATEEDAKIFVDTIENPPAPNEKLKNAFEKQPKQETLEEAAKKYGWRIKINTFSDKVKANELAESAQQDFIEGAKSNAAKDYWFKIFQQDKNKYSDEEVLEHLNHLIMMPSSKLDKFTNDEEMVTMKWFNQFKKK